MISDQTLDRSAPFHGLLERGRLRNRIATAASAPLVLIVAPAGCGKSVALGHYLASLQQPYLRFNVRSEHRSLVGFVRGFAEIAEAVAPGMLSAAADACTSALATDAPESMLSDWLERHLANFSGTIAIDDMHLADERSAALLATLIERANLRASWIVATRRSHHLPVVSWVANGRCALPIESEDLCFTLHEARESATMLRSTMDVGEVDRLLGMTSGWAAGFALALRKSEHSNDFHDVVNSTRKLTYRYLNEHVYAPLSNEERETLLFGALLPDFDIDVMEQAGFDGARRTLRSLEEHISFLSVAYPSERRLHARYLCHDLFRDFLVNEVETLGDAALRSMRLRAAEALAATGRTVSALRLFAKVRATDRIVELLGEHGPQLLEQAHGDSVKAAIGALPDHTRSSHPTILGLRAQQMLTAGHFKRSISLLRRAIAACAGVAQRTSLEIQLGLAMLSTGEDPSHLLESAVAREGVPASLRGQALALLALAYGYFEHHHRVTAELIEEIESIADVVECDADRAKILQRLGAVLLIIGDVNRSTAALLQAAELALEQHMFKLAHSAYSGLCINALVYEDDLSKAITFARVDADCSAKSGELVRIRSSRLQRMDIEFRLGNAEALTDILKAFESEREVEDPRITTMIVAAKAMLAAWNGRFAQAHELLRPVCDNFWLLEERLMNKAWCALFFAADGRRDDARMMIEAVNREGKTPDSARPSFERYREIARAICGLTEAVSGRVAAARVLLRKKPSPATPITSTIFETVRSIVDAIDLGSITFGAREHIIAMESHQHGGYARVLEQIVTQVELAAGRAAEVLTPAELAVLRAVASGQSPKVIALETGRSILTVRTLLRRVIDKLGCSGRDQAIRIARSRSLI